MISFIILISLLIITVQYIFFLKNVLEYEFESRIQIILFIIPVIGGIILFVLRICDCWKLAKINEENKYFMQ